MFNSEGISKLVLVLLSIKPGGPVPETVKVLLLVLALLLMKGFDSLRLQQETGSLFEEMRSTSSASRPSSASLPAMKTRSSRKKQLAAQRH